MEIYQLIQNILDSFRYIRRRLYAIPEGELGAMSLQDQIKYATNLHEIGLAILKLEAARLKGINKDFEAMASELQQATAKIEVDTTELADTVKMIRALSEGLTFVTNFMKLLD